MAKSVMNKIFDVKMEEFPEIKQDNMQSLTSTNATKYIPKADVFENYSGKKLEEKFDSFTENTIDKFLQNEITWKMNNMTIQIEDNQIHNKFGNNCIKLSDVLKYNKSISETKEFSKGKRSAKMYPVTSDDSTDTEDETEEMII